VHSASSKFFYCLLEVASRTAAGVMLSETLDPITHGMKLPTEVVRSALQLRALESQRRA